MSELNNKLLVVNDLKTWFPIKKGLFKRTVGHIKAVDGISFDIAPGQTFGLVGESGCGKTTAARSIVRLIEPTAGKVTFEGIDVISAGAAQLQRIRKNISVIFQDPYGSLNPRMTVSDIISEPMIVQRKIAKKDRPDRVADLLEKVGLSAEYLNRYPHEFSGGQRQRIGVARALALEPKLIICDEPVSALDVSIQSQILNLLKDLQQDFGLTYMFIAHDLAVVEFFCEHLAVMYMGKIVEKAGSEAIYKNPFHPYTKILMSAIPQIDTSRRGQRRAAGGEIPSLLRPPRGCPFNPRCPLAQEKCREMVPELVEKEEEHFVACWMC